MPLVYRRTALHKRVEDFGHARIEGFCVRYLYLQRLVGRKMEPRHTIPFVEIGQTVDPGVHVHAIEFWKTKRFAASCMERVPIGNPRRIQANSCHINTLDVPLDKPANDWMTGPRT